jgi:phosphopantetheine adenylyltransferase
MAKKNIGYRYKPQASNLFQPARIKDKQQDTISSLASQERNLTRRFNQVGQPTPFESDGQLGLLAELTGEKPKDQVDKRNLLEKALNLKPEQGVIMDILEVMDRPRQVVSNILSSLGNEDDRNILAAAWDGLAGRKRLSTKEALQKMVGDDEFLQIAEQDGILDEVGNFVIDLGLDIFSDPTTYTGLGLITKPLGGAAKWAGKSLVELGEAGLKSTNKYAKAFGQGVKLVQKSATNIKYALNAKAGLTDDLIKQLDSIGGGLGEKARKYKMTLTQLRDELAKYGDEGDKLYKQLFESNSRVRTVGKNFKIETPDVKLKAKTILEDILTNFKNKKIRAYILPEVGRQTTRNANQVDNLIAKLNKEAGSDLFIKKLDAAGDMSIEISQKATQKEVQETIERILGAGREKGSFLRKQITFKGALVDTPQMKEWIKKIGVKNVNSLLATGQDVTRKARDLLSDLGKYKIGGELTEEGTRYMRRVITQEGKDFISQRTPFVKKAFTKPGKDVLTGRTYSSGLITSEINRAMKNLYGATNDVFNESAIASLNDLINVAVDKAGQREALKAILGVDVSVMTGPRSRTVVSQKIRKENLNFFKPVKNTGKDVAELGADFQVLGKRSIEKQFSNLFNNLPEEMKMVWNEMLEQAGADVGGDTVLAMNKSVYGVLKNLDNAYREVPEFIKMYDGFLNTWKEVNLLSPAFNGRNFLGNSMNMYVSGMGVLDQARYTTQGFFDLKKYDDLLKKSAMDPSNLKNTLTPDELRFMDEVGEFFREGISQSYKNTRDLDSVLKRLQDEASGKIKAKKGVGKVYDDYVKANFKAAENIDNMQRYAMWKWKKAQLGKINPGGVDNGFKAAQSVKESLFDYTNLTSIEKDYMKRLIPFYTFFKNNLIFQAKNITKMPNQYKKMLRAYKYWGENIADLEEGDIPEYMSGNMWLPIPLQINADDQEQIMWLKTNLPLADFTEFIDKPLKKGISSVSVPIKLIWELGTGSESFTGAPIEQFEGQQKRMEDPDNNVILNELRGKNGEFYLSGDPTIQKLADELGLRTPRRLASSILDVLDVATGAQTTDELVADILNRTGFTDTKSRSELELSALYQRVEKLRNLKKLYEQNVGALPFNKPGSAKQEPLPRASAKDRSGYLFRPK